MSENDAKRLMHQSGVNQRGEPFVQLILDGKVMGQMTPTEARDHARAISEAAEAAETDAFLIQFFRNELDVPRNSALGVLMKFREFRERAGKSGPPSDREDWVMPEPPPT
jgi:hypothetical protein